MIFIKTLRPFAIAFIFLLLYVAEHIFPERESFTDLRHDFKNILIDIFNVLIIFWFGYYFQKVLMYVNGQGFGVFNQVKLPYGLILMFQFIFIDIFMYWWHRANHTFSFLWQFHKLHHTDEKLNTTSAIRFHGAEIALSYVARLLVFPLFGISVNALFVYSLVFLPVVVFHHSNIKINQSFDLLIRKFIVSPKMHRIHHSKIMEETNSNYSSVFSCWDKLFKSNTRKPLHEIDFGLEEKIREI
jgi:sterol desaturase/sphingolipid hydroxylase (fatty acid hydroxylase superfamily)